MNHEPEDPVYIEGSGNVFADLSRPDADELQVKAELVYRISHIIRERGLTQAQAAQVLGLDQPKVSNLLRGRLSGFSTDRLLRLLNALGRDIEIVIIERPATPERRATASVRVVVAAG